MRIVLEHRPETTPREELERVPHVRPATKAGLYLSVRARFALTVLVGLAWAGLSAWISLGWIEDLGDVITLPAAIVVIAGMALVPGYLNMQLAASLLLDRPKRLTFDLPFPAVTAIVAAYNEEASIGDTLAYVLHQDYPGPLEVVVVDDGSTDGTARVVREIAARNESVRLVQIPHGGKAAALNAGLAAATTPVVATIDADTVLMPTSLRRAVARLVLSPPDTAAVAGSVLARNSRSTLETRVQQWDYFLGIASVKREQALLQGTLVAQGAFSVYDRAAVERAGGWEDTIGEDIVLTWALLAGGGRTGFEPTAIAFTATPSGFRHFVRQRQRWARGMIEGLREHGLRLIFRGRTYAHSVFSDLLFPYLDLVYTIAVPVGIGLAITGNFLLIGPLTLAVIPVNALIVAIMFRRELRAFREVGLHVRRRWPDLVGLLLYALVYQLVTSPVSCSGYAKELFRRRRVWK